MVTLQCPVLLLYQQFGFPGSFGNHPFGIMGSVLWQPGLVDSLVESSLSPYCFMGMDYHEGIFGVCVDVNLLSLGQY